MNQEVSEWNGALDYLKRIDAALEEAGIAAIRLDVYMWLHSLKLFYREISSVMKEEQRKELYEESKKLSENINEYLTTKNNKLYHGSKELSEELIEGLEQFEIKLRQIYKETGLQMRLMDDASKALR